MFSKKILIIDDEILLCWSLKKKLENYGFQVTTVHNGEKAVEILKNTHFDAILTDIRLPGVDGFSIIKTAKLLYPKIHAFLMSAYNDEKAQIQVQNVEFQSFFDKPFDLDSISNLIANTVKKL